jgi:(S)-mandelate dehydrogenase
MACADGVAPTGLNGALWPDADIHLAKSAYKFGIPFALSAAATSSIEAVRILEAA